MVITADDHTWLDNLRHISQAFTAAKDKGYTVSVALVHTAVDELIKDLENHHAD